LIKGGEKLDSEKILKDSKGNPIGYELEGKIVGHDDSGADVEIRPERNQSVVVKVQNFEGDYRKRPHSQWNIGDSVRVLIVTKSDHVLVPQTKNPS
jgi:predicted RNA-binding protein with RPS1 domain